MKVVLEHHADPRATVSVAMTEFCNSPKRYLGFRRGRDALVIMMTLA